MKSGKCYTICLDTIMGFTTAGQNLHPPAGDKVAATMFTAAGDSDRKTVWVSLP